MPVELVGQGGAGEGRGVATGPEPAEQRPPALGAGLAIAVRGHRALSDPALVDGPLLAQLAHRATGSAVQVHLGRFAAQQRPPAHIAARVGGRGSDFSRRHRLRAYQRPYALTASLSARASSTTRPARCPGT